MINARYTMMVAIISIIAPSGAQAWNPSFDVTPAALVDVIVTEKGVVEQPTTERLVELMN